MALALCLSWPARLSSVPGGIGGAHQRDGGEEVDQVHSGLEMIFRSRMRSDETYSRSRVMHKTGAATENSIVLSPVVFKRNIPLPEFPVPVLITRMTVCQTMDKPNQDHTSASLGQTNLKGEDERGRSSLRTPSHIRGHRDTLHGGVFSVRSDSFQCWIRQRLLRHQQ